MSTTGYANIAEALSGLVNMAISNTATTSDDDHQESCGASSFLLEIVDGELAIGETKDSAPGRLSFRGLKCMAEKFHQSSSDGSTTDDNRWKNAHTDADNATNVRTWIQSLHSTSDDSHAMQGQTINDTEVDNLSVDYDTTYDDDIDPEDYFYTSKCPELNHLRSLSVVNRWTEFEFVVSDDSSDVSKLTEEELNFFKFIFVFLSAADDLVNLNIGNLQGLFEKKKDIVHYYVEQECIEAVHSRVYSLIQLMLFRNNAVSRAEYVKNAIKDPAITAKISWLDKKVQECSSIAEKYILMAVIEGVFFSSSFAAIAFLRINNIFPVTCQLNTLISRDEALHVTASCLIYNKYLSEYEKPSPRKIHSIMKEAVAIECEFLRAKAPADGRLLDLQAIYSFVRFSADRILSAIGVPTLFDEPKPASDFPMAFMFTADNTNFFERRNTAYSGCVTNDL